MKISRSRSSSTLSSSRPPASRAAASSRSASSSSDASNRARVRMPEIALKRPVETSQARGFGGNAIARPLLHRGGERVVQRLLRQLEVAEQADQGREHAAGIGAVDGVHRRPRLPDRVLAPVACHRLPLGCYWLNTMIGRTSMLPVLTEGIRDATWMASFRSLASIR